jgi:1-acyl-sn-glycerol-3-phosphate acyltransferase
MNMNRTVFNTPVVTCLLRGLALLLLKICGWKAVGKMPDKPKFVMIVAWHTSNWDLFYGAIVALALKADVVFLAKRELFRRPFGALIRWLGGIPIERKESHHIVSQMIQKYNENERFVLAIAPEGTRHKVQYWKSGFYHIAYGARVPVLLTFLDYEKKCGGAGPLMDLTGDMEKDFEAIREFYSAVRGKYPENTSPAVPHPEK